MSGNKRNPPRVSVRRSNWGHSDGTQTPVMRLYSGERLSIAVSMDEAAQLIADLAQALADHRKEGEHGESTGNHPGS